MTEERSGVNALSEYLETMIKSIEFQKDFLLLNP